MLYMPPPEEEIAQRMKTVIENTLAIVASFSNDITGGMAGTLEREGTENVHWVLEVKTGDPT